MWDDRAALYGERRPFVLHYYLADDSVEVLEVSEPNSGRDPFPVFLRRQPLPNKKLEVDALGPTKSYTYYTHKDLRVGNTVNVYGRGFLIHDADNFTKAWYIQNEGYSEADFPPVDVEEEELPIPQNAVPPYNGFGGLADSLQNCVALIPKPVRPNFDKQMNYTNTILRFRAKMQDDDEHVHSDADKDRDFIISVYLANDTISVFEPPDRAKNVIGGKFLERQECLKPGVAERYEATDCYAGAVLTLFSRKFLLTEADGYTYGFMEAHGPSFPRSDFAQVMARFRALGQGKGGGGASRVSRRGCGRERAGEPGGAGARAPGLRHLLRRAGGHHHHSEARLARRRTRPRRGVLRGVRRPLLRVIRREAPVLSL